MRDRARHMVESAQLAPLMTDAPHKPTTEAERARAVDNMTAALLATQPVKDAATCVEQLVHHIATSGVHRVLCQVEAAGNTSGALDNLPQLSTEVFPEVRRNLAERHPRTGPAPAPQDSVPRR
ncbi:hypothetical protein GL263_24965 [Streptomyces durbertensis]|uniref:Uncharacterized protein n=1 Tax=Streptomyces durbertensis TaxID=2448886 RepID=A0ABR6EN60_9ACTN|nr:hypothetical protein [Streptomyces durbertensis]MBB1246777.1 hypothetical protein [Streptomyces durbertensis]